MAVCIPLLPKAIRNTASMKQSFSQDLLSYSNSTAHFINETGHGNMLNYMPNVIFLFKT